MKSLLITLLLLSPKNPAIAKSIALKNEPLPLKSQRKIAPSFQWTRPTGTKVSLQQYKGKVLYINFWSQTCAPCLEEIPYINQIKSVFNTHQLQVLYVNMDTQETFNKKETQQFIKKNIAHERRIHTHAFKFKNEFTVEKIPSHILIDKEGRLVNHYYGSLLNHKQHFKKLLFLLLGE